MTSDPDGPAWDDAVDVICVGDRPGVLAYGAACAAADLDVLHVGAPGEYDAQTAAYLAAMTDDLHPAPPGTDPMVVRAVPEPLRRDDRGRPDVLEPFVGQHLRDFCAGCMGVPSGVLFTEVPDLFARMRTDSGDTITVVRLVGPADPVPHREVYGALVYGALVYGGLVYDEGRIAGAVLGGPAGQRRVRADAGLAFAVGPPGAPGPGADALVSRPAGRFARLAILESCDG